MLKINNNGRVFADVNVQNSSSLTWSYSRKKPINLSKIDTRRINLQFQTMLIFKSEK